MSFETEAALSLVIPQGELRSARQSIEEGLAGVELELGEAAMSTQATRGGGEVASRDRARTRQLLDAQLSELETAGSGVGTLIDLAKARNNLLDGALGQPESDGGVEAPPAPDAPDAPPAPPAPDAPDAPEAPEMPTGGIPLDTGLTSGTRLDEERNELLDDAVIYLESLDDALSEDGLLGGGGAGGLAAEVLGIGGDFAAEGAAVAAETATGLATDVAGTALGQAAGSVIAQQISGSTVGVEPNPLPVEGGGSGGDSVTVAPDLQPVFKPTFRPTFQPTVDVSPELDLPDLNFGGGGPGAVRVDESQLPLAVEETLLAVERPSWMPIPVENLGPMTTGIGAAEQKRRKDRSFGGLIDESLRSGAKGALAGAGLGAAGGAAAGGIGALPGAAIGAIGGGIFSAGTPFVEEGASRIDSALSGNQLGETNASTTPTNLTADVTYQPTYNVDVDPRRLDDLADRIIGEIEDRLQRDIDELESDLQELERNVDDLEREITRGR